MGETTVEDEVRPLKLPQAGASQRGLLIEALALLPAMAIIDETRLAAMLNVTPRTVRRMVSRFELPPPVSLGGRSVWVVGRVLSHIDAAAERQQRTAERQAKQFREIANRD